MKKIGEFFDKLEEKLKGAIISLGLSFAKSGIKKLSYEAAKLSAEMERKIVNQISQPLVGINIKK